MLDYLKQQRFDELFESVKALPWEESFPKDGKFWVVKHRQLNQNCLVLQIFSLLSRKPLSKD